MLEWASPIGMLKTDEFPSHFQVALYLFLSGFVSKMFADILSQSPLFFPEIRFY